MADAVAIVSIVSGAAVALGAPLIASRGERKRVRLQVNEARLDELRGVMDSASIAIVEADLALDDLLAQAPVSDDDEHDPWPPTTKELGDVLVARVRDVWRHEKKLAVRLGPEAQTYRSYRVLAQQFTQIQSLIATTHNSSAVLNVAGVLDRREVLDAAEAQFLTSASQLVGPMSAAR